MWLLAFAIWLACKLLTWRWVPCNRRSVRAAAAYFFTWPGMDAHPFTSSVPRVARLAPLGTGWKPVLQNVLAGAMLCALALHLVSAHAYLAAWLGMIGTVLLLHFGLFDLIAVAWRARGV